MVNTIDLILYIQQVIWFISAGYLIYLMQKTKLTHVDEFRQKVVLAIYFMLFNVAMNGIFTVIIKIPQEFIMLLWGIMVLADGLFITLTLIGTSKLIDYISSIIDFETKNKKKNATIISIIITIFLTIIYIIFKMSKPTTTVVEYILFSAVNFFFWLTGVYFLFLDQELKKININILRYFGIGIFCMAFLPIPSIFMDVQTDMSYWIYTFFGLIGLNLTLILGYLDFKNKISKGLGQ